MNLIEQLKHARRVSVPLVAIATPDPAATIREVGRGLNGGAATAPMIAWDCVQGFKPCNEGGQKIVKQLGDSAQETNPVGALVVAAGLPAGTVTFVYGAAEFCESVPPFRQALWNLRDIYKADRRMLVLLGPEFRLRPEIKDDVIVLDESLPTPERLAEIVRELDVAACVCGRCGGSGRDKGLTCGGCAGSGKSSRAAVDDAVVGKAVEAVQGLAAFSAEQAIAMALRPQGIDLDHLWDRKRKAIEQTRGLSVYRGGETYADLGGLGPVKEYFRRLMTGRLPARAVVWLDEIGQSALAHTGDTSGVNADYMGTMLSYMEDHGVYGVMLLGVPGAGKSALAKATGPEFGKLTVRCDIGAMQGSLVGESQTNLRAALRVIEAVSGGRSLWLATANSVEELAPALRSRFVDTFFFDLPTPEERTPIWDVWLAKYPDVEKAAIDDEGWTGRNIRQCVEKAWAMDLPLSEAAKWITPVAYLERESIERLRALADGRYLSASQPGVYTAPRGPSGRRVAAG